ncbi:hypothetical protein [Helicobacter japonicus]|uniref:Cytochrome C n=1 Tax=Helicobacter japonicus TaxID=425400 RepID=A0A4V6I3X3_9HELI|nr:hypothetical protein [Helicobacter japonicus]TLE01753.1 hypothetical protein LS65_005320 [Helicobacter japonicus]
MRILLSICLCICGVLAQNHQLTKIMQDMEYAMEQMQRGFLYNKKEWIDAGLNEFKELNKQLARVDSNLYLKEKRDMNVANRIVSSSEENIDMLERFLKQDDMVKSVDTYGRILKACVSCHIISRGW